MEIEQNWGDVVEETLKDTRRGRLELIKEQIARVEDKIRAAQAGGIKRSAELLALNKQKDELERLKEVEYTHRALLESERGLISDEEAEKYLGSRSAKEQFKKQKEKPN